MEQPIKLLMFKGLISLGIHCMKDLVNIVSHYKVAWMYMDADLGIVCYCTCKGQAIYFPIRTASNI